MGYFLNHFCIRFFKNFLSINQNKTHRIKATAGIILMPLSVYAVMFVLKKLMKLSRKNHILDIVFFSEKHPPQAIESRKR